MLPLFRRKKSWVKYVMSFVIVALAATTLFLFVGSPTGSMSGGGAQTVADIAGQQITAKEFSRHYSRIYDTYNQMYNLNSQPPEIVQQLGIGENALNQLVSQYAVVAEAEKQGLEVSSDELVQRIKDLPFFQVNGQFVGVEQYKIAVQQTGYTAPEFEAAIRREVMSEKLRNILTDGIRATEVEARQQFIETNQEASVRYVVFDPENIKQDAISDDVIKAYYDEHSEDYREPEKRKIKYIGVERNIINVDVTEDEIREQMPEATQEEKVHARHILIRFGDDEAAARKEADNLLSQLSKGGDFAALANEHSDDTANAASGGDLGFVTRGTMVPEFETVLFNRVPGLVDKVVRTDFGFHLIDILERAQGDTAARAEAEFKARNLKAYRVAGKLADQIHEEVAAGESLENVAAKHDLKITETGLFDFDSGVPGLARSPELLDGIFSSEINTVVKPAELGGRSIVASVIEIAPSRLTEFEEVKDKVAETYSTNQAREMATQMAEEFAGSFTDSVHTPKEFEANAKKSGLEITTTALFKKGVNIDDVLRFSEDVHAEAFGLETGEVSSSISVADRFAVFQVAEKTEVDEARFESEKSGLIDQMTDEKQREFFNSYVQNIIDKMRRDEEIQINQQLVSQITG
jgi:peptidyl-prolyl cis-trans isomerase D